MSEGSAARETAAARGKAASVRSLVPFVHVADVERSVAFYRVLGFELGNLLPREGQMNWAWLYSPDAAECKTGPNLMIARSQRAMNPGA